ncbi:AMP-binding protein [Nocardia sp. CA-107356]|uniref:AMP-binding protein n=1 Tax=Nocardia sp. CA-107356 TaxID=3239972 RepID=UPI003D91A8EC
MLSYRNILAGLAAIVTSSATTRADVWVQWTPLHHDMGLFGILSSVLNGGHTYAIAPQLFIRRPEQFLALIAEVGGTLMTGPNFSYDLQRLSGIPASAQRTSSPNQDSGRYRS